MRALYFVVFLAMLGAHADSPIGTEYIRYYHEDRTHLGLGKGTPDGRTRTVASSHLLSHPRLGGLHHRYDRAA